MTSRGLVRLITMKGSKSVERIKLKIQDSDSDFAGVKGGERTIEGLVKEGSFGIIDLKTP